MGLIHLENIRTFSHHGCMPEETIIGSDYRVDLWIEANLNEAADSDDLTKTPDYVVLHQIVVDEMAFSSKLLEHVCRRILDRIKLEVVRVEGARVRVAKINPPIGGDVSSVSVEMSY